MKISNQNKSLSDGFKLKFRILGKQCQTHWVARIAPNKLVELRKRGKISMGWSIHSFQDYVHETRCFRRNRLWHFKARCPEKEELCGRCGQPGHQLQACVTPEANCVNCLKGNGRYKQSSCPSIPAWTGTVHVWSKNSKL